MRVFVHHFEDLGSGVGGIVLDGEEMQKPDWGIFIGSFHWDILADQIIEIRPSRRGKVDWRFTEKAAKA
jgi:hypothetical protein